MRLAQIRFPDPVYTEVQHVAQEHGVSAAQYIREATLMRLARDDMVRAYFMASGGSSQAGLVVVSTFAEQMARQAEKLGAQDMADRIRRQYLEP
jgi:hypothetical protein